MRGGMILSEFMQLLILLKKSLHKTTGYLKKCVCLTIV